MVLASYGPVELCAHDTIVDDSFDWDRPINYKPNYKLHSCTNITFMINHLLKILVYHGPKNMVYRYDLHVLFFKLSQNIRARGKVLTLVASLPNASLLERQRHVKLSWELKHAADRGVVGGLHRGHGRNKAGVTSQHFLRRNMPPFYSVKRRLLRRCEEKVRERTVFFRYMNRNHMLVQHTFPKLEQLFDQCCYIFYLFRGNAWAFSPNHFFHSLCRVIVLHSLLLFSPFSTLCCCPCIICLCLLQSCCFGHTHLMMEFDTGC